MSFLFERDPLSEQQQRMLLDRIRHDDVQAENIIVEKYDSFIKKQVKNRLGTQQYQGQTSEDYCQDIRVFFLKEARKKGSQLLKEDGTIGRWLSATIKNKMYETWRNQAKIKKILDEFAYESTDKEDDISMDFDAVEKAVDQLDNEESKSLRFPLGFVRQLCIYRFTHNMEWAEVAEALNRGYPDFDRFPTKKPLTANYLRSALWNGNYKERLRTLLKSIRD